jgi:two-component system sensor histidine kinase AgrC
MIDYFLFCLIGIHQSIIFLLVYHKLTNCKIKLSNAIFFIFGVVIIGSLFDYFSLVFIFIFFTIIEFRKPFIKNKNLVWFQSIYTTFSTSLFGYLATAIGSNLYDTTNFQQVYLLNVIIYPLLALLVNFYLLYLFKEPLDFLNKNVDELDHRFLFITNFLLTTLTIIQISNYWIEKYFLEPHSLRLYLTAAFTITLIVLLRYLRIKTQKFNQLRINSLYNNQLKDLAAYVQQMETMYDEIRSFHHDYQNVLISLNESLKTNDLSIIENTYNQILSNEGIKLKEKPYSLSKLNHLKTLPIKGIFSTQLIKAWQKKIPIHLEIEDIIKNEAIDILDYVRICSILLENAIEAAEKANKPYLKIAFLILPATNEIKIIIENSCKDTVNNLTTLFEKGTSSKGFQRGIGLATVNNILKNNPHVSLQTESESYTFRQILLIKEEIIE